MQWRCMKPMDLSKGVVVMSVEEYHHLLRKEMKALRDRNLDWELDHEKLDWELRKIDLQTMADR